MKNISKHLKFNKLNVNRANVLARGKDDWDSIRSWPSESNDYHTEPTDKDYISIENILKTRGNI